MSVGVIPEGMDVTRIRAHTKADESKGFSSFSVPSISKTS
jgi:hypothetical protein